ncbi:MAG: RNA 2',3'-cyclic phosphodiesterase [Armatimonadota bacterium]|nr:RNA 2',3'-cyclic phosphodiesterase [Armatimonadota bacterium]
MADIRTFIAVLLTAELRSKIGQIQDRFRKAAPEVKWVAEDNFHVTMKFLGNIDEARLESIYAALERAVADGPEPFSVNISDAGAFPNVRRPQTIWVGLREGTENLAALAGNIESELDKIGFPKEGRKFSSHITIGRVKYLNNINALAEALQSAEVGEIGVFDVRSITVMKSDLRREGPVYSVQKEIPLNQVES